MASIFERDEATVELLDARLYTLEMQFRSVDAERSSEARLAYRMESVRSSLSLATRQYAELVAAGTESPDVLESLRTQIAKCIVEFRIRKGDSGNWETAFVPRPSRG
jgi:hypothetical protein